MPGQSNAYEATMYTIIIIIADVIHSIYSIIPEKMFHQQIYYSCVMVIEKVKNNYSIFNNYFE